MTATLYVTYRGTPETRFDRAYYVDHHLPLVMRAWGPTGLHSIAAFFRDETAIEACLASPATPAVMADVAHFTDVAPTRLRAIAL